MSFTIFLFGLRSETDLGLPINLELQKPPLTTNLTPKLKLYSSTKLNLPVTKSLSGHSLGAAGVHESIFSLIMLNEGFLSGSANIENLDKELEGTPILLRNKEMPVEKVLSNSFGFGGTNACLIFERYN